MAGTVAVAVGVEQAGRSACATLSARAAAFLVRELLLSDKGGSEWVVPSVGSGRSRGNPRRTLRNKCNLAAHRSRPRAVATSAARRGCRRGAVRRLGRERGEGAGGRVRTGLGRGGGRWTGRASGRGRAHEFGLGLGRGLGLGLGRGRSWGWGRAGAREERRGGQQSERRRRTVRQHESTQRADGVVAHGRLF